MIFNFIRQVVINPRFADALFHRGLNFKMQYQLNKALEEYKKALEINPDHILVKRLQSEQGAIKDWSLLLYEQALIAEGGQLSDPGSFVRRVNDLLIAMSMR